MDMRRQATTRPAPRFIGLVVSLELKQAVDRAADAREVTTSHLVRQLIRVFLKRETEGRAPDVGVRL
jgi:predicted transcriptional regulator